MHHRHSAHPRPAHADAFRRRWLGLAGLVFTILGLAGATWLASGAFVADPHPEFAPSDDLQVRYNSSAPPPEDWGGVITTDAHRESATVWVEREDGTATQGEVAVGDSATIDGITVTICATWLPPRRLDLNPFAEPEDGIDTADAPATYFVASSDGTVPVCPDRVN